MFYSELYERAFKRPARNADTLFVITGYTSSAMVFRFLSENPRTRLRMIVGMTAKDGVSFHNHMALLKLATITFRDRFTCMYNYGPTPIHIKAYAWFEKGVPIAGYIGSANFSQTAFWGNQMECLADSDPSAIMSLYCEIMSNCWNVENSLVSEKVYIYHGSSADSARIRNSAKFRIDQKKSKEALKTGVLRGACVGGAESFSEYGVGESIEVTLLTQDGERVHAAGGLNWGQREDRERNQAYIPLSSKIYKTNFFPKKEIHFTIITDDGEVFNCVRAQEKYGKAIETYENNSLIGKYFRKRIGVDEGSFVSKEDLEAYGRTSVTMTKLDRETFLMDFSV